MASLLLICLACLSHGQRERSWKNCNMHAEPPGRLASLLLVFIQGAAFQARFAGVTSGYPAPTVSGRVVFRRQASCPHRIPEVVLGDTHGVQSLSRRASLLAAGLACLPSSPAVRAAVLEGARDNAASSLGKILNLAPQGNPEPPLASRLEQVSLKPLTASGVPSRTGEVRYPSWMLGTWKVTNNISSYTLPQGESFVDRFEVTEASKDLAKRETLSYEARYVKSPQEAFDSDPMLNVIQDRRFNAIQESNAFFVKDKLGFVSKGEYQVNLGTPHGLVILQPDVSDAATVGESYDIDILVQWVQWDKYESGGRAFITDEILKQTYRVSQQGDGAPAPGDVTFAEVIVRYEPERPSGNESELPNVVNVRNRIVRYLSLPDQPGSGNKITMLARGSAVSIFDYNWRMVRVNNTDRSLELGSEKQR